VDKIKLYILYLLLPCLLFLVLSQMCDTDNKDLGRGFVYNAEYKHILGRVDIPPTIISYNFNMHFIVAKQKPKRFDDAIYDKMEYVYSQGRDTCYYWLIIKQEQRVFGPLDFNRFQDLKEYYKVPDELTLE